MDEKDNTKFDPVALNLKTEVGLPKQVILPMVVYRGIRANSRTLSITDRQQDVPRALKDWMRADSRYRDWFADDEPEVEPVDETETSPTLDAQLHVPTDQVHTELEVPADEAVNADHPFDFDVDNATVDELRDYATQWNINLKGASLKADIQDRIREVIGG